MKPHLDIFAGELKAGQFLGSPEISKLKSITTNVDYVCEGCGWAIPKPDRYGHFEWFYCPVCGEETIHKDSRLK